jgi:hypothetical protein
MPVQFKSLAIVLVCALAVLLLARHVATPHIIRQDDFRRRAALWLFITAAAFVSRNYWLFAFLTVPFMALAGNKDSNRLAVYFFLLFAIPPFLAPISGMGVFGKTLIELSHSRWLALTLLLPAYLSLRSQPGVQPLGSTLVDKFFIGYLLLMLVLEGMDTSATNLLRIFTVLCLDSLLPYYVASRALRTLREYRDAIMSFIVACLLMAPIAFAEYAMHWLMYMGLGDWLGLPFWGFGRTLNRGDLLRAQVTAGQPIVLGFTMVVALALIGFLRPAIRDKRWWWLGMLTLAGALLVSLSRGPWVGAAAMLLVMIATGPRVMAKVAIVCVSLLVLIPVLLTTPQGQQMLDYLPFVGTVEAQNVEFRQRLFEVSMGVLGNFPFFGALDFIEHPDMEQLRGSDGIIDIVNTYVRVALSSGLVGLTLFLSPFILVGVGIVRALYALPDKASELHLLGRCLLAALVGILVTIGTVSPILFVPLVYIAVIGMGVGYLRMVAQARVHEPLRESAPVVTPQPQPAAPAGGRGPRLGGVHRKAAR